MQRGGQRSLRFLEMEQGRRQYGSAGRLTGVGETGRRKRLTKCQAAAVRVTVKERERMLDMEVGWQLKGR
ncbi:MAG: hypothetical protein CW342_08835 [Thermoactinomycetaceae bacterium]|nr:hypothetical protein [Bacillota bacterium]MBO2532979.1 hypothetical protein [Thermoactinomycetaceae bacterium]